MENKLEEFTSKHPILKWGIIIPGTLYIILLYVLNWIIHPIISYRLFKENDS